MPMMLGLYATAVLFALSAPLALAAGNAPLWPAGLPIYDHIVVVVEENKDYDEIVGSRDAPYINQLAKEGATFTKMFAEEHFSQGNYFWLFSGNNQNVGFDDVVPKHKLAASSLGEQLIRSGRSFKGYSESLPAIGSETDLGPESCRSQPRHCVYARKHVPWISFANVPNGNTIETSSNLRFADFPSDFSKLPTVAFVIPNLENDMHNGRPSDSIPRGDAWLRQNLDPYYQWAKNHNSLLIVTFDENDDKSGYMGLTDPAVIPHDQRSRDLQNRIVTIFAGAHVKANYLEKRDLTHVNLLRTIEAMYGLPKSGAQQPNAARAGISDDAIAGDVFEAIGRRQ